MVRKEQVMSDLIKREDAIRAVAEVLSLNRFASFKNIKDFGRFAERMLRNVPSADRPQDDDWERYSDKLWKNAYERGKADRPQGEWLLSDLQSQVDNDNGNYAYVCTNCNHTDIHAKTQKVPYCWWCGARMKGADDE